MTITILRSTRFVKTKIFIVLKRWKTSLSASTMITIESQFRQRNLLDRPSTQYLDSGICEPQRNISVKLLIQGLPQIYLVLSHHAVPHLHISTLHDPQQNQLSRWKRNFCGFDFAKRCSSRRRVRYVNGFLPNKF